MLNAMSLAGVRYWGHHETFPDAYAGLAAELPDADGYDDLLVLVLEAGGEVRGFLSLADRGDHVELVQMFLATDFIGRGYGRKLWDRAVVEARAISHRMLIMSDPQSIGFYEAMGARLERRVEVSPGFSLAVMWYDLARQ